MTTNYYFISFETENEYEWRVRLFDEEWDMRSSGFVSANCDWASADKGHGEYITETISQEGFIRVFGNQLRTKKYSGCYGLEVCDGKVTKIVKYSIPSRVKNYYKSYLNINL